MKTNFLLSIGWKKLSILQGSGRRVTALSTMIVLLTGIIAFASIPGANGVIHVCYNKNGDSSLRVIDSTARCRSNEIAFNFNQTGPQGLQGLQGLQGAPGADGATGAPGPAGMNGRSEAYFAPQILQIPLILAGTRTLLSKNVPAGSYVINAKVEGRNFFDGLQRILRCELSTGDSSTTTLEVDGAKIIPLQDTVTFDAPATITLACTGFNISVNHFVMTAIKVNAVY
ncbi:MAG: hypothetical protein LH614_20300 [Pyrinomonadaceae bacterium]|nr:hypothetical protein [Pyrinomonadaceae bacterium]